MLRMTCEYLAVTFYIAVKKKESLAFNWLQCKKTELVCAESTAPELSKNITLNQSYENLNNLYKQRKKSIFLYLDEKWLLCDTKTLKPLT